ncbi:hypothetical protein RCJ22_20240 [Vibrio sp. FNV 38]|nr:hypothetical protein [Vibrio sp. FNV 38]
MISFIFRIHKLRNSLVVVTLALLGSQSVHAEIPEQYTGYIEFFIPVLNAETDELLAAVCHNDKAASVLLTQALISEYLVDKSISSKEEVFINKYTLNLESAVVSNALNIEVIKQETMLLGTETKTCTLARTLLTKSSS